jgi:hypothetical protein
VIVFAVHEHGYKQCTDDPLGTFIAPVPEFVEGYLSYYYKIQQDKGNDDYLVPGVAQFTECTRQVIQNQEYWLKMGCADGTSQSLAVNIYSENTCTTKSSVDGFDDSNIDVSAIQVRNNEGDRTGYWVFIALQHFSF